MKTFSAPPKNHCPFCCIRLPFVCDCLFLTTTSPLRGLALDYGLCRPGFAESVGCSGQWKKDGNGQTVVGLFESRESGMEELERWLESPLPPEDQTPFILSRSVFKPETWFFPSTGSDGQVHHCRAHCYFPSPSSPSKQGTRLDVMVWTTRGRPPPPPKSDRAETTRDPLHTSHRRPGLVQRKNRVHTHRNGGRLGYVP